jgi:penicillin V acylase-like amidase (Ntn superfamily)
MSTSPQLKSAREDASFYKKMYESLSDRDKGLNEVLTIIQIQRDSGILYLDWPGATQTEKRRPHDVDSRYWFLEATRDEKYEFRWPNLTVDQLIPLLVEVRINQATCKHEDRKKTGEAIPMGSFTAQPERCQRCGQRFSDD